MDRTTRHALVTFTTALLLAPLAVAHATEFHVAIRGNDAGSGSLAAPLAHDPARRRPGATRGRHHGA